jgi:hypothetical protein
VIGNLFSAQWSWTDGSLATRSGATPSSHNREKSVVGTFWVDLQYFDVYKNEHKSKYETGMKAFLSPQRVTDFTRTGPHVRRIFPLE